MSQQTYPVACECGVTHRVTSGQAGSSVPCECGRSLQVPAFSVLRTLVVDEWASPEVELDARARLSQLPTETTCVLCGCETTGVFPLWLCVETPSVSDAVPTVVRVLPSFLPFRAAGEFVADRVTAAHAANAAPMGDYIAYELPVRACDQCGPRMTESRAAKSALQKTPLYARLVRKYPQAELYLPSGERVRRTAMPPLARHRKARRISLAWTVGMLVAVIVTLALLLAMSGQAVLKNAAPLTPMLVIGGVFLLAVLVGASAGVVVNRWHRARWPETLDKR